MNLTLKLTGFDALIDGWAKAPEMIVDEIAAFAEGAALYLQGEIQEHTPAAAGQLKQSFIAQSAERLGDGVIAQVGTSLNYAIPVELGTKPHFPPVAAIADWVKVKLGIGGPAGEKIAWAIARKISKVGTKGAHMVQRAFDAGRPEVLRQFEATVLRIKEKLAAV